MKRFDKAEQIVLAVYEQVATMEDPTDMPVTVASVMDLLGWPQDRVLLWLPDLLDSGVLIISPLTTPPLLYLTRTGLALALRRKTAA